MNNTSTNIAKPYMNPYLAGFLLGIILLITFYITGSGLGASGAIKSTVISTVAKVSPDSQTQNAFVKETIQNNPSPLKSWLVFEVLGMLIGGFLSGFLSGRLNFKVDKGPQIKVSTRLIFAVAGGLLFGIGSQLGRGCTSGAALSGMAVFSTAGFVTMMAIFGTGYVLAYFFRKLWI